MGFLDGVLDKIDQAHGGTSLSNYAYDFYKGDNRTLNLPPTGTPSGTAPQESDDREKKAVAEFAAKTGREPTEWEKQWARSEAPIKTYGDYYKALNWQADRLKNVSHQIKAMAGSSGITLTDDEANKLRNEYLPATGSSSDAEIGEALQYAANKIQTKKLDSLLEDAGIKPKPGSDGKPTGPAITEEHRGNAGRLIQETYGRAATRDEVDFFAARLAEGESPYEVSQFLSTTPEYLRTQSDKENQRVKAEEKEARAALDAELQKSQAEVFNRASADIISRYQRAGRIGSSGVANSLAKAQADLERERQTFLGGAGYDAAIRAEGYGREDFVNRNAAAFSNYLRQSEPGYQQKFNLQGIQNNLRYGVPLAMADRTAALGDQRLARGYETQDYQTMGSDYFRYMNDYYNRAGRAGQTQGMVGGAQAGAQVGGTYGGGWGALFGALLGGGAGYYGSK